MQASVEARPQRDGKDHSGKLGRTRHMLVAAIRAEVAVSGNFTAELIAQRAGISPATFYNHFATKDEALMAAYVDLMHELETLVASHCHIERLLDIGVQQLVSDWLLDAAVFFCGNAALFRLAQAALERSKPMRDLFRQHEQRILHIYQRLIELGQTAQVIRAGDVVAMAQVVVVISEGWYHPLIQKLKPGSALHQEMTDVLTRMLCPQGA